MRIRKRLKDTSLRSWWDSCSFFIYSCWGFWSWNLSWNRWSNMWCLCKEKTWSWWVYEKNEQMLWIGHLHSIFK